MKPAFYSVPFSSRAALPPVCGIYFVVTGEQVVYVGLSNNIKNRWANHHILQRCTSLQEQGTKLSIVWFEAEECLLEEVEWQIVSRLRPTLNSTKTAPKNYSLYGSPCGRYLDEHLADCADCKEHHEVYESRSEILIGAQGLIRLLKEKWQFPAADRLEDKQALNLLVDVMPKLAKPQVERVEELTKRLEEIKAEEKIRGQRVRVPVLDFEFSVSDVIAAARFALSAGG